MSLEKLRVVKIRKYGWRRSLPDPRDLRFTPKPHIVQNLPQKVDWRGDPSRPMIWDQGDLGSCTAHGSLRAYIFTLGVEGHPEFMPSRLFQYYNTRYIEGTTDFDSGAEVRDALKALTTVGVCDESLWPYVDSALTLKPSDNCYEAAKLHVATKYYSINNANPQELMSALTQKLFIVFGCAVYAAFEEVGTSGEVPMPDLTCNTPVGGHCMTIVGYEPTITSVTRKYKQWYIVDNSWGEEWGDKGSCIFPDRYILDINLSSDFWVISADT